MAYTGPFPIVLSGNTTGVVISDFVSGGVTNTGPSRVMFSETTAAPATIAAGAYYAVEGGGTLDAAGADFGSFHE